jgi:hypothetical protein
MAGAQLEQVDRFGLTPLAKIFTNTFSEPIPCASFLVSKGGTINDRVIEMGMSWDKTKFSEFLNSIDFEFEPTAIPQEEDTPEEVQENQDTSIDNKALHYSTHNENYLETTKIIWKKLVPKSGQANTVQGELLRAIEKLRDEAQRNGNGNFNKNCHGLLLNYLDKFLIDERIFETVVISKIKKNLANLSNRNSPYLKDDIYDYISNRIVDWYLENPDQLAHKKNDKLYC